MSPLSTDTLFFFVIDHYFNSCLRSISRSFFFFFLLPMFYWRFVTDDVYYTVVGHLVDMFIPFFVIPSYYCCQHSSDIPTPFSIKNCLTSYFAIFCQKLNFVNSKRNTFNFHFYDEVRGFIIDFSSGKFRQLYFDIKSDIFVLMISPIMLKISSRH